MIETPVLLSVTYGLRRSEAMGLKWDAVDFEHQTLTIRHTVTGTGKNRVCEDRTKTKSSRRSLYLLPEVAAHLQEVRQKQTEMQALLKNQYHADGYICTWEDGRLISPEYLSRKFREILLEEHEKSGLPVYRYHDLRHSSASLLVGEGESLKQVGEWLGHSSPATTNRYAHLQFQSTVEMATSVSQRLFVG